MICDHPECTGVHNHHKGLYSERCPRAKEKRRATDLRYRLSVNGRISEIRHQIKRYRGIDIYGDD